jgi:hypothetical protein
LKRYEAAVTAGKKSRASAAAWQLAAAALTAARPAADFTSGCSGWVETAVTSPSAPTRTSALSTEYLAFV